MTPEYDFVLQCNEATFTDLSDSCVPLTYSWDFGDGSPISSEINPVHNFEYDNDYNVTLTINDGTQDYTITKSISVISEFLYEIPLDLRACSDANNPNTAIFDLAAQSDYILNNVNPLGPFFFPVTYHLSISDAENNVNPLDIQYTNISNPQTIYARVEDSQACSQIFPFSLITDISPTVNTLADINLCFLRENSIAYDLTQLTANVFEGLDQSNISISYHNLEADAINGQNTISTISLIAGVDFIIYVRAENIVAPECFTLSSFNIRMDNENTDIDNRCMPFFANTMTPNGDGANDSFFIQNIETFPNNHLIIYNRWGHIVYETNGYLNDWEGTYNGKLLPAGTYYYIMELNDEEQRKHSGYLSILR